MSVIQDERIVQSVAADNDPDVEHLVCHCTEDKVAGCGLDVSTSDWASADGDGVDCPLCALVWFADDDHCPWGCPCDDC